MEITKTWNELKSIVASKNLQPQYEEMTDTPHRYFIFVVEDTILYTCKLLKVDASDFEANYKTSCNKPVASKMEEDKAGTGGNFQMRGMKLTVPANSSNSLEVSWLYPIRILAIFLVPVNDGDEAEGVVGEHTTIGAITANVTAGDTEIAVQDTVKNNVFVGVGFRLTDGTNTEDFIVIGVSENNITLDHAADNGYSAASPAYCQMTVKMSHDKVPLKGGVMCECGGTAIGGSMIPKGAKFKLTYYNNSAAEVDVYYKLEYWY